MAKRARLTNAKVIDRRLKEGRGQGRGGSYKPWLTIQDVASTSPVIRVKGNKTGRVHHFLSLLEYYYFLILEWSPVVVDIREQYPLPLDQTLLIAADCSYAHPKDPKTRENIVMTTDFYITVLSDGVEVHQARTVKPSTKLGTRQLHKFEIERRYWQSKGISWGIVTELEIPMDFAKNVDIFHPHYHFTSLIERVPGMDKELLATAVQLLNDLVRPRTLSLSEAANRCDSQLGLQVGNSLAIAYYLLANKYWQIDMYEPFDPNRRFVLSNSPALVF